MYPKIKWAQLVHLSLNKPSKIFCYLTGESFTIGRDRTDLEIKSKSVSHIHLTLVKNQEAICLIDSSTNGTSINDKFVRNDQLVVEEARTEISIAKNEFFILYNLMIEPNSLMNDDLLIDSRFAIFTSQKLGEGSYSNVNLGIDMLNGQVLAAKVISKRKNSKRILSTKSIRREIDILSRLSHPNIVRIRKSAETDDFIVIFMDKINGGELFQYIYDQKSLKEPEAKFIFYQLLLAIQYLHQNKICHRDLKPENILMEKNAEWPKIYLTDFGMAKSVEFARLKTQCGTFSYLAPEIINGKVNGYSEKVDCWSLGVILYTMYLLINYRICGSLPFGTDDDISTLLPRIQKGEFSFPESLGWNKISQPCKHLIKCLINVDQVERYSIEEALMDPWISDQRLLLDKLLSKISKT